MKANRIHFQEFTRVAKAVRIDREAGVIYDLAILGPESKNNRRYTENAMRKAVQLYEGLPSNANHVKGTNEPDVYDSLGIWRNVRYDEDGRIRGNFHYFKNHRLTPCLLEAAERPDLDGSMGFSHDAFGTGRKDSDGTELIESIESVESVDLVARPATVKNLFESVTMTNQLATPLIKNRPKNATGARTKKTLRTILTEALSPAAHRKKRAAFAAWLKEMDGDSYLSADDPMETTPGAAGDDLDADPPAHGKELMQQIVDLIDKCLETADNSALDPDYLDKLQAMKEIAASHGDGDDDDDDPPPPDNSQESRKALRQKAKQLQEKIHRLESEGRVRKLCDEAKFLPTETQLKALIPLGDVDAKALIENLRTANTNAADARKPQKPFSQAPGQPDQSPHSGEKSISESFKQRPNETDEQYRARRVNMMRSGNF